MLVAIFFASAIAAGRALSRAIWARWGRPDDPASPFERAASAGLVALALALAADWVLALGHVLTRGALIAVTVVFAVASVRRPGAAWSLPRITRPRAIALAAAAPLFAWVGYVVWRDASIFAFTPDALSYHLPRALFFVRQHGLGIVDGPDARLTTFPANYEILLANVIALTGRDDLVFIVGLLAYGLYGLLVAAMAERWWGRGALHTCAAVLLSLGIPTTLLSSGAQKNDLLLAALLLGAAHFGARWAVRGERACLLLAITAAAIAIGTKPTAGVLVLALAPCVVWRMRARRREGLPLVAREAAHWFGVAIASGLLLGGEVYVMNLATIGAPWGHIAGTRYGEWHHLWAFPALAFLRGLSPTDSVWVPWRHQTWFWSQWDLFFSSYGAPTSLLTLSLPWAVARYRREGLRAERALATGVLVLAFLAMLPVGVQEPPYGFFVGYVRYTSYVPVVVVLWTAVPWIRAHARDARAAYGALVVASACFALYAIGCMNNDIYAPLSFVLDVRHGDRFARAQRSWTLRAGGVVDRFAGQDDVIAFDGGLDSWSYPAYGRELRRTVIYLHPDRGPVVIGDDVKWVVVDRAWHALFGHPKMTDLGVWFEYIAKGSPLPEDVVVLHQLENDPRWKLVWREDYANQAVFMRVPPAK